MFSSKSAKGRPPAYATEVDVEGQQHQSAVDPSLPTAVAQPYEEPRQQQNGFGRSPVVSSQPQMRAPPGTIFRIGNPDGVAGQDYTPSSYTCPAILGFCCFWPLGLFALFTSCATSSRNKKGDYDGAAKMSRVTKILSLLAIFLGIAIVVITLASYYGSGADNSDNNGYYGGYGRRRYGGYYTGEDNTGN